MRLADDIERQLGFTGDLVTVKAFGNKLAEHAGRLAAVLRLVEALDANEVTKANMEAGVALARHYAAGRGSIALRPRPRSRLQPASGDEITGMAA
jgi:hypothetical protein